MTGENLEYKPSVVKQAKFDYSPLGKIFNDGLKEENKKEGLLKSVKNIGDKNEELLKAFSAANTVSKAAKNQSNYNYDNIFSFYGFTETLKQIIFKRMSLQRKFKRMSLGYKYDKINHFYTLLNAFINTHEATTTETKNHKNKIRNNFNQLHNKYFDFYKKKLQQYKCKN